MPDSKKFLLIQHLQLQSKLFKSHCKLDLFSKFTDFQLFGMKGMNNFEATTFIKSCIFCGSQEATCICCSELFQLLSLIHSLQTADGLINFDKKIWFAMGVDWIILVTTVCNELCVCVCLRVGSYGAALLVQQTFVLDKRGGITIPVICDIYLN